MADTPKERMLKKQIDIDHWRRKGEKMTDVQVWDSIADSVVTNPQPWTATPTIHRGTKKATKYKRGGMVGNDYPK